MSAKKINIAIDGYSSCGKSTIAKSLARKIGYIYIDSGAMYRAVALFAYKNELISEEEIDEAQLQREIQNIKIEFFKNGEDEQETYLNGINVEDEIRSLSIANIASKVSTLAFVRKEMVKQQQQMGRNKGVVMDGRDIGTVVFPDAEMKIFVTASPEVRAERRFKELKSKSNNTSTYAETLANLLERDERDSTRSESPLRKAEDAYILDNSKITQNEQLQWAIDLFNKITRKNEEN